MSGLVNAFPPPPRPGEDGRLHYTSQHCIICDAGFSRNLPVCYNCAPYTRTSDDALRGFHAELQDPKTLATYQAAFALGGLGAAVEAALVESPD